MFCIHTGTMNRLCTTWELGKGDPEARLHSGTIDNRVTSIPTTDVVHFHRLPICKAEWHGTISDITILLFN